MIVLDMDHLLHTEHEILEDYVVIGSPYVGALIHRNVDPEFHGDILAAVIAKNLGISLGYARKRYVPSDHTITVPPQYATYQQAYRTARNHLRNTISRFSAEGKPTPRAGVLFSDATLRRLEATFFAAGLLFRTGHLFEARAVARMILEQVAWAYAIRSTQDSDEALKISVTGSVSHLKKIFPQIGRLYGDLSSETHLGLEEHPRFLDVSTDQVYVRHTHGIDSWQSGLILLQLADYWSVVYELTQEPYMDQLENWIRINGELTLRPDRPFLGEAAKIKEASNMR